MAGGSVAHILRGRPRARAWIRAPAAAARAAGVSCSGCAGCRRRAYPGVRALDPASNPSPPSVPALASESAVLGPAYDAAEASGHPLVHVPRGPSRNRPQRSPGGGPDVDANRSQTSICDARSHVGWPAASCSGSGNHLLFRTTGYPAKRVISENGKGPAGTGADPPGGRPGAGCASRQPEEAGHAGEGARCSQVGEAMGLRPPQIAGFQADIPECPWTAAGSMNVSAGVSSSPVRPGGRAR